MAALVKIALRHGVPRPPMVRATLADASGGLLRPQDAVYTYPFSDDIAWAYGEDGVAYALDPGAYTYVITAGPCWTTAYGELSVSDDSPQTVAVKLERIFNPGAEGWVSGDIHVHLCPDDAPDDLLAAFPAEGIDFAGIQYWGLYTGRENVNEPPEERAFRIGSTWVSSDEEVEMHSPWGPWEDSRVVALPRRLPDLREGFGYRMNARFYEEARRLGCAMVAYQSPTWAQVPVDVALGLVDGVNVCDNYFSIGRPVVGPWGYDQFSPDDPRQSQPYGIAHWVFEHYYRLLNAGSRLPVSGGSAYPHGGAAGPVGTNRFYVEAPPEASPETYFANWRAGRTFATNGPILLARVDGVRPSAENVNVSRDRSRLSVHVVSNRPVKTLEWVADGEVIASKELSSTQAPQDVTWESELDLRPYQWLAARCFGESERTLFPQAGRVSPPFLVAHTSPFYLGGFDGPSPARARAIESLLLHIDWMEAVVLGKAEPQFADPPFSEEPLSDRERAEILEILSLARTRYRNRT